MASWRTFGEHAASSATSGAAKDPDRNFADGRPHADTLAGRQNRPERPISAGVRRGPEGRRGAGATPTGHAPRNLLTVPVRDPKQHDQYSATDQDRQNGRGVRATPKRSWGALRILRWTKTGELARRSGNSQRRWGLEALDFASYRAFAAADEVDGSSARNRRSGICRKAVAGAALQHGARECSWLLVNPALHDDRPPGTEPAATPSTAPRRRVRRRLATPGAHHQERLAINDRVGIQVAAGWPQTRGHRSWPRNGPS